MRGHPGAGTDEQVTADGARVSNLALAHRSAAHSSSCLAELIDLEHNAAQVARPVLVQTGCHGQWDGGGRYSNIWWSVSIRQLPGPIRALHGQLLKRGIGGGGRSCTGSLREGL